MPAVSARDKRIRTRTGTLLSPKSGNRETMQLILRKVAPAVKMSPVSKANTDSLRSTHNVRNAVKYSDRIMNECLEYPRTR